jgi:hypothetical protein
VDGLVVGADDGLLEGLLFDGAEVGAVEGADCDGAFWLGALWLGAFWLGELLLVPLPLFHGAHTTAKTRTRTKTTARIIPIIIIDMPAAASVSEW